MYGICLFAPAIMDHTVADVGMLSGDDVAQSSIFWALESRVLFSRLPTIVDVSVCCDPFGENASVCTTGHSFGLPFFPSCRTLPV